MYDALHTASAHYTSSAGSTLRRVPAGVAPNESAEDARQIQAGGEKLQSLVVILAIFNALTASLLAKYFWEKLLFELREGGHTPSDALDHEQVQS